VWPCRPPTLAADQEHRVYPAGCEKVYAEKISGARSDRPQLARMLRAIGAGETIIVTRLDRLARSTDAQR
jgi:DNA invertase Pin-like site-specific DNA recombinase